LTYQRRAGWVFVVIAIGAPVAQLVHYWNHGTMDEASFTGAAISAGIGVLMLLWWRE
jgi:hypothetical protein